jgi:hypothetical protein
MFNAITGVKKMKFGIELECYNVSRETIVNGLRAAGLNACVASYSGRAYDQWQVKTDGSIQGQEGFELVSPVLEGELGIAHVRIACQVLKNAGAKVNTSCGFHVHHDASDFGIRQFRNLFKRFVKHEAAMDSIMEKNRRANENRYIGSMGSASDMADITVQARLWARIEGCRSVNQLSNAWSNNRYLKLNLQSFFRTGTIEFRHHHGTVNGEVVERWIRFTAGMVQQARENVAIRAFPKQVTTEYSLELMLWTMKKQGYLPADIAASIAKRAAGLKAREAANA